MISKCWFLKTWPSSGRNANRIGVESHRQPAREPPTRCLLGCSAKDHAQRDTALPGYVGDSPVFNDWVPGTTAADARLMPVVDVSGHGLKLWAAHRAGVAAAQDAWPPQRWTPGVARWLRDARRWASFAQIESETRSFGRWSTGGKAKRSEHQRLTQACSLLII